MTEPHLTIEQLATRLKMEPAAVKTLLSEIAVEPNLVRFKSISTE
jgi:hypothetical protein